MRRKFDNVTPALEILQSLQENVVYRKKYCLQEKIALGLQLY